MQQRQQIAAAARQNFILERELSQIDDKIKLLIKNRISVQDILSNPHLNDEKKEMEAKPSIIAQNRQLYEEFFWILQQQPKYLAILSRLLNVTDMPVFVQMVVFDLFGDQYDTREERQLLLLFQHALRNEIAQCNDRSTLLRSNTAVTQMLSSYARRGQGLTILKEILGDPIREICADKTLNLEVQPLKVYTQLITDHEMKTGQPSLCISSHLAHLPSRSLRRSSQSER